MKINEYLQNFTNDGFVKIENAINKKLILKVNNSILNVLNEKKKLINYEDFRYSR